MKICTIVGARPQFIKAAAVSRVFRSQNDMNEIIIHTGQHYDANMSDVFFSELDIPKPHYNLGIGGGSHGQNTGRMIEAIETVLLQEKPQWLLVYGDTDSTLAGALAAAKIQIPIAHVEAGLRSFNRAMPEEINRILTDHASELLFTPTKLASQRLVTEGIDVEKIKQVGDVMYDAALYYRDMAQEIKGLNLEKEFVLCTLHRAENTSNESRLAEIIKALKEISAAIQVILPLHPRTAKIINNMNIDLTGITVIDPVGYLQMIFLLQSSSLVITDSGGLQKEAYFFQKPCITTRDQTEWVELIESGNNVLAGADRKTIVSLFEVMWNKKVTFDPFMYGDGKTAEKIISNLQKN
jgi:UDP-GlcNAc3NAcA epimerase